MTMSFRTACLIGFSACAAMMAYALYAQHGLGLEPCPLCILQRMAVIAVGVAFLAGALHSPRGGGRLVYAGLALLAAAAGGGVAAHHVWLQSLPADQVPACGPGFDYMMDAFPLSQALRMIFAGSGECAEIDWTLFGLSMPVWTLVGFVVLALWAVWTAMRRSPSAH
jgi:disulfide bond formation protein DsbB